MSGKLGDVKVITYRPEGQKRQKTFFKSLVTNTEETKVSKKDIPTQYLLDSLKESEADVKAGRVITFATGQDALNYLDEEIGNDQKNK